ncbi:MAG: sugar phosphate isomerase/epimerase [Phycisphaerae bacterium]
MQLGVASAILPDLELEDLLAFAAECDLECVEVMCWPKGKAERRYAGVTHIDVDGFGEADAKAVRQACEDAGVAISALGYYPNPLSPDEDEARVAQEHLAKVIDAAAALGLPGINTFIGRDPSKSVDDNWPRLMDVWPPLVARAGEKGLTIGIENCPMLFTGDEWPGGKNLAHSPAVWRRLFEAIPDAHLGLNYDPSHLVWQMMDYAAPLRAFADRLFHLHAKDVRVDRHRLNDVGVLATPLEFHTPKLPGLGQIDWGHFVSVLTDVGYAGPVCIEVEDRAYEGSLEDRKAAVRQSATFLRNFIPRR